MSTDVSAEGATFYSYRWRVICRLTWLFYPGQSAELAVPSNGFQKKSQYSLRLKGHDVIAGIYKQQ